MTVAGYDKIDVNKGLLLDLPFEEGVGVLAHDVAKPHHVASLAGHAPAWSEIVSSGLGILDFGAGLNTYLEIPGADTLDLDFTGDFSLAAWICPIYTAQPLVIMCRNTTGTCGWCMWLYNNITYGPILSFRASHGGVAPGYSECWAGNFPGSVWQLAGYSYDSVAQTITCYKNGLPITTNYTPPFPAPVACGAGNKVLIGCQEGEASNWYEGKMRRPRAWGRTLSDSDWRFLWNSEKHGVEG